MTYAAEAAAIIARYDGAAAAAYLAQPFHRRTLATAFERGFRDHSDLTRKECRMVAVLSELDAMDRAAPERGVA